MILNVDHTEVMTLLENNSNICDACLLVQTKAAAEDLIGTLEATTRCMELIIQAVKSNTGILSNISERNFPRET